MFYAFGARFDVTENLGKFLVFEGISTRPYTARDLYGCVVY